MEGVGAGKGKRETVGRVEDREIYTLKLRNKNFAFYMHRIL